ncbi:hypothetical protein [Massilia scottii]|uniref:hypothetical protein n=1 Tax=Massilia scottii TaxID=3057166 RepID=UPI0027964437|nr:hypothetical protein [Massilia sp. CCM 9029]MDQ1835219.1 hypothetical protein [Massilia sp. CCM 9029]
MPKNMNQISQHDSAEPMRYVAATIKSVLGPTCEIDVGGVICVAEIATHILSVVKGQRVAVMDGGGEDGYLVIAAWPLHNKVADEPLSFDAATGTLRIQAARLNLAAVATIELHCGEARLRMTLDGKVHIEGIELLSAAIGSNKIEGASIDLN